MVMKTAGKIRDQMTTKMTLIKENLGHLAHAVKIMLENKRVKIEARLNKSLKKEIEEPKTKVEIENNKWRECSRVENAKEEPRDGDGQDRDRLGTYVRQHKLLR
ncbi:4288_t:CDS:2, partial [Gigaspora rosea]